jgi:alpha-D-ribose 1-methylphosphonate 5-triphosphate synthase subunit PhnI
MGYVAVSGGREAIEESIKLLKYHRSLGDKDIEIAAIRDKLSLLVDRVMGEAGLYMPDYAALALKQCEGCIEEAVFLLRAYRSTLTRNYYSVPLDGRNLRVIRRISSAFKDIQGGQILGPTYDYTQRLIDFDIENETPQDLTAWRGDCESNAHEPIEKVPRVSDVLQKQDIISAYPQDETPPDDVTMHMLEFPASRSARLQTLARADSGYISGLAYSVLRGSNVAQHPTVGELRCGYLTVEIPYLFDSTQTICVGEILVSEVESFVESDDADGGRLKLSVGYGVVFGRNENKAIAMSILDNSLNAGGDEPTENEEFVLMHGDSLEMNGFISHLKLPHYVTFQSKLDSVRKTREFSDSEVNPKANEVVSKNDEKL